MPAAAPPRPALRPCGALTRRRLLASGAGALLAAGCAAPRPVAPGAGYPRTVATVEGPVALPTRPRRVAALNGNQVGPYLLPFLPDVEIVAWGERVPLETTPWLADALAAVPALPYDDAALDLEQLALLAPDLNIGNAPGDVWAPTAAVAPLLTFDPVDWRATTTLLGEVFELPGRAADAVATTERLIADARRATPVTAAVIGRYSDPAVVDLLTTGSPLPALLDELGVATGTSDAAEDGYEQVSLELVADRLDVDHLVVLDYGHDPVAAGAQDALLADPLIARLPVVREGRVVRLTATQTLAVDPPNPATMALVLDALAPVLDA
jgi:iron complex transport system substrate-binding protein